MRKRFLGWVLTLSLVLCLLPMHAFAADITLDVGMANTENDNYKVMDNAINIRKDGQVYELTGTTDRKIQIWGSNSPDPVKTYYLRLNNATVNGGISITNSSGAKLVIEVVENTNNTIKRVYATNLTITGAGTINTEDLGTAQSKENRNLSELYIKDTTIKVTQPVTAGDSSQWNGTCVLDGKANVTFISNTEYSPLKLAQTYGVSHSLTLKGDAKLYCLQANAAAKSNGCVNGLEAHGAVIKLQDNAYLEAQGRDRDDEYYWGCGIVSNTDIIVEDNATVKATGYDVAISTWGNFKADGGKIIAKSEHSNGIYADDSVEIKNAKAEVAGYWPALYGNNAVSVENSTVNATSTGDCAIYSRNGAVKLKNSIVRANGADGCYGIYAESGVNVSDSWVETTGPETLDDQHNSIENSVLFNGNDGNVIGNATIPDDVTVLENMTLNIPVGTALTVPNGKTLTNNGTINLKGKMNRNGTIICNSHTGGTATCKDKAKCDICETPYGNTKADNHAGKKVWTANDKTHVQKWDCCGVVVVAEEDHDWENGVCTKCEYACKHTGGTETKNDKKASCTEDGYTGDTYCKVCTAELSKGEKIAAAGHTGGTATCKDKAKCEVCGESYGELNSKNHSDLKHFDAKAATKDNSGNNEYWYCDGCGKYFSDAKATKEIAKADTVTAKLSGDQKSPKTGDNRNMLPWIALLFVSGSAAIGTAVVGKKKKHNR